MGTQLLMRGLSRPVRALIVVGLVASVALSFVAGTVANEVSTPPWFWTPTILLGALAISWPALVKQISPRVRSVMIGGSLLAAGLGANLVNSGCRGGTGGASRVCLASSREETLQKFTECPSGITTPLDVNALGRGLVALRYGSLKPIVRGATFCGP